MAPSGLANQQATKVVAFKADEAAPRSGSFVFVKEKVVDSGGSTSSVSQLADIRPRKAEFLTIFLGGNPAVHGQKPLRVSADKTALVEEVIRLSIRAYAAEQRQPSLPAGGQYQLRLAENDGTPDLDLQELNPRLQIMKFGKTFMLMVPGGDAAPRRKETGGSSSGSSGNSADGTSVTPPPQGGAGVAPGFLLIYLPNAEKTTFRLQPDLRVGNLLSRICTKRNLHHTDYHFKMVNSNVPIKPELTLQELGVTEIKLCPNKG